MANEKRLIDANDLKQKAVPHYFDNCCYAVSVKDIDDAPTVDAVEVVRCKDCKHWKPSGSVAGNSKDDLQPIGGCKWVNFCRKANDFCSYGERREA